MVSVYVWSEVVMVTWADALGAMAAGLSAIVGAVALFAVFGVRTQLELQRKQLHRELEARYVDRYWLIADRLASHRGRERLRAIDAYLQLSDDEIELRRLGRVTDETWAYWRSAILDAMTDREFQRGLRRVEADRFELLRALVRTGVMYDPIVLSRRQRRRAGLA